MRPYGNGITVITSIVIFITFLYVVTGIRNDSDVIVPKCKGVWDNECRDVRIGSTCHQVADGTLAKIDVF